MMEFIIKKGSVNPVLRMELIKDGRYDFKKAMIDNAIQDSVVKFYMKDVETGLLKVAKADADIVLSLIENTQSVYSYDQDIMDIITDEVAAFFAGEKTAEDTAAMVQSRVNLYVQEQS